MAIDRYSRDYRIVETVDEKGRIRSETEYIGSEYVFAAGRKRAAAASHRLLALCAVAWLAFLAALLPQSTAMRTLYAALPCAFTALPLWHMSAAAVTAFRLKEPFAHRDADRVNLRLPAAGVFAVVLTAGAVIGGAASLLAAKAAPLPGDWVFLIGNLICLVCAALCQKLRKDVEARAR